ncbi:uncharacterized protein LOC131241320 [Magnolia sinica]|uniref:uncharacterized protein LOC131241320 n=1 Tax=Magnolia sinica TaxID=86752 RepID=UPI00265A3EB6|nr:uncharacterized protein LOC131241320 [Magnolia sinica]
MAFPIFFPEIAFVTGASRIGLSSNRNCKIIPKNSSRCGETRSRLSVTDLEVRVSGSVRDASICRHFSAPARPSSPSPSKHKAGGGNDDKQNYYMNTGYAIRTLREEFPELFYRELSFDIYRDDIVFKDPLNTFAGIENYKLIFWALRFHGRIFFKALWVDIISVWQPVEKVIMIRWTVHGIPRVPWESLGRFDGTSEYKLDKDGKIYEHRVDNVALNSPPSKFRVLSVEGLIQALGCPSTPKPTYFETSLSPGIMSYVPFLVRFTWVRYYLAFNLTIAWRCGAGG